MQSTQGLYAAYKAKDARFDGRFFVGVRSTGIYCRPVCKAKLAREDNCSFFVTAAEAEQAGYRPCLLCRPELAPGHSSMDASASLARRAARIMEEHLGGQSIGELAGMLGCTDRHLRRVFAAEYHVSPVQYLQTCRLLLAKNLLTDTDLSVLDISLAAGFQSLRRFNDLFVKRYRLSPRDFRKHLSRGKNPEGHITLALSYRPPYPWEDMLSFLSARAIPGVEAVSDDGYLRTVRLEGANGACACGWLKVTHRPDQNALGLRISESLLPALSQVLARVRRLFDLCCEPHTIYDALSSMDGLIPGVNALGTRLPGSFDAFEMSVKAVLGQQITVKAARTLAGRLASAFGTPLEAGIEGLTHLFPSFTDILSLEGKIENHLGPLGIIAARSRTIQSLAKSFSDGALDISLGADPREEIKKMLAIPGIGAWTAQYIAMRAMGWPDAFLETDAGIKKALPLYTAKQLLDLAQAWRPFRSYATVSLWNSL